MANFSASASAAGVKAFLRSSSAAASDGNCSAARSAEFVVAEGQPAFQHRRQHHDAGRRRCPGRAAARAPPWRRGSRRSFRRTDISARRRGCSWRRRARSPWRSQSASARMFQKCLPSSGFDRAAPAGADRIDQHQVGEREPGVGIVAQLRGRGVAAVRSEIENARADQAEMQEGGRRAGAAVEHESKRPVRARVFGDVGGVEHRRALVAGLVVEGKRAGGRRVGELAFRRVDRMFGDGIGRQQPQHAFAGFVLLDLAWLCLAPARCASCAAAEPSAPARTIASARREMEFVFMARRTPERPLRVPPAFAVYISAGGSSAGVAVGPGSVRRPCGGS